MNFLINELRGMAPAGEYKMPFDKIGTKYIKECTVNPVTQEISERYRRELDLQSYTKKQAELDAIFDVLDQDVVDSVYVCPNIHSPEDSDVLARIQSTVNVHYTGKLNNDDIIMEKSFTVANENIMSFNVPVPMIKESMLDSSDTSYLATCNNSSLNVNGVEFPYSHSIDRLVPLSASKHIVVKDAQKFSFKVGHFRGFSYKGRKSFVPKDLDEDFMKDMLAYPNAYFTPLSRPIYGIGKFSVEKKRLKLSFRNYRFEFSAVSKGNYEIYFAFCANSGQFVLLCPVYQPNYDFSSWLNSYGEMKGGMDVKIAKWVHITDYDHADGVIYHLHHKKLRFVDWAWDEYEYFPPHFQGQRILQTSKNSIDFWRHEQNIPGLVLQKLLHGVKFPNHMQHYAKPYGGVALITFYPKITNDKFTNRYWFVCHDWDIEDHVIYYLMHYGRSMLARMLLFLYNIVRPIMDNGKYRWPFVGQQFFVALLGYCAWLKCPICKKAHTPNVDCNGLNRHVRVAKGNIRFRGMYKQMDYDYAVLRIMTYIAMGKSGMADTHIMHTNMSYSRVKAAIENNVNKNNKQLNAMHETFIKNYYTVCEPGDVFKVSAYMAVSLDKARKLLLGAASAYDRAVLARFGIQIPNKN